MSCQTRINAISVPCLPEIDTPSYHKLSRIHNPQSIQETKEIDRIYRMQPCRAATAVSIRSRLFTTMMTTTKRKTSGKPTMFPRPLPFQTPLVRRPKLDLFQTKQKQFFVRGTISTVVIRRRTKSKNCSVARGSSRGNWRIGSPTLVEKRSAAIPRVQSFAACISRKVAINTRTSMNTRLM